VRVLVVGSTGYIGKFVVKELIRRGFAVVAFAREQSGIGGKQKRVDTERVRCKLSCRPCPPCLHACLLCHALLRQASWACSYRAIAPMQEFAGAEVRFGDVQDMESLRTVGFAQPVDVVVSCLASRTGGKVHAASPLPACRPCPCAAPG
jgi:divinyl chlorophyllide a 8-vinyl-reductase